MKKMRVARGKRNAGASREGNCCNLLTLKCADGEWISEREEIESSKLKVESEEEKKESPHAALPFATLGRPENKGMQVMRMASGTCWSGR
jgi:hypothetical protein